MRLPILESGNTSRHVTDVFSGYDHRLKIADGAFFDTKNLSSQHYPLMSTRPHRGTVKTLTNPGGIIGKDALCYVADGTLYVNDLATPVTGLSAGEKQLVSMGAYVVIFPDKVYYNTEDPTDYGSMEATYSSVGTITYAPCRVDGTVYENITKGESEPTPTNGALWIDTSDGGMVLRQYSSSFSGWTEITNVYTRITFSDHGNVPDLFKQYDGVTVSGAHYEDLNGQKVIYAVGGDTNEQDYIVLVGLYDAYTDEEGSITVSRTIPQMDYICECQNRLWGCFYGNDGEKNLNEIYCSALGDFKNFRQYMGLSTDSWTASVGSDGQWTGAINYLGRPTFFKENRIHQVTISATGGHRIDETICRGVQKGSFRSLKVVGESLYYKSRDDVCTWQGGFPIGISTQLGDVKYDSAVAGTAFGLYYLSMRDGAGNYHLFTYDAARDMWYREDNLHALYFDTVDGELFCVDSDGHLLAMRGSVGTLEGSIDWIAETGTLAYETADRKYVSRFNLSLRMAAGDTLTIWIQYDSDGVWHYRGHVTFSGLGTVTVPIRPRRCDHLQIRLTGTGDLKLYAITRIVEIGSDM